MTINILFLCTHNSARSVLAECMLNQMAKQRGVGLRAFSAGSAPSGQVKPLALQVLKAAGIDTNHVNSKSWDEFALLDAPQMSAVITVCDSAAAEQCPIWPGAPVRAHWGYPDPSDAPGDDSARTIAFELTRQAFGFWALRLLDQLGSPAKDSHLREALAFANSG